MSEFNMQMGGFGDEQEKCPKCGQLLMPDIPMLDMGSCKDCHHLWMNTVKNPSCPKCGGQNEHSGMQEALERGQPDTSTELQCQCGYKYKSKINSGRSNPTVFDKLLK